ncbi:hypothetical protein G3578_08750 [Brevibacillus sp. SYP-B805]|uniref:hypothetical protein n=1 Tax=Brevibacillus sp. SYP-B805 TaxID=1578199 RepID=UPI0013EC6270|nr:hypothetical protein [Brevibacillus sp. SYP-B805]NGQ95256.1 hypothetical protein [Brevibacillus sp. SYP-B805]
MSYCCGAGMIGSIGTVRHQRTLIRNVPILYCPACDRIDVHPSIEMEYEILVEYAQGDRSPEVDFSDFVNIEHRQELFENCTMVDDGTGFGEVLRQQIDISLDLLGVAKALEDDEWRQELKDRLHRLSERLNKYNKRKEISQRSA